MIYLSYDYQGGNIVDHDGARIRLTFLQTLRVLYNKELDRAKVDTNAMQSFLKSVSEYSPELVRGIVNEFKRDFYLEFCESNLSELVV